MNQLTGPVPPELGNLANLTYMSLSRNQLTGTIPPELAKLSAIRILSVSRNNLTGTIPPELGTLSTLEGLYLYQNQLTGGIPVALGNLSELETLWIHDNGLSGPLIEELAGLAALEDLRAANNELSGQLPRNLGRPRALARVELEGNQRLTGLLPRSMIGLEFLQVLSYGATDLCAQIDDEFQEWLRRIPDGSRMDCDVARVERLALTDLHDVTGGSSWANRAAWATDAPLGDWHGVSTEDGRVTGLTLPANGLSGPLPAEIANLTELRVADLAENDLSGALPSSFAGLHELAELRLGRNPELEAAAAVRAPGAGTGSRAAPRRHRPVRLARARLPGVVHRDRTDRRRRLRQSGSGHGIPARGLFSPSRSRPRPEACVWWPTATRF